MTSLHARRRDHAFDPACFGCKAGTLSFGAVAGPVSELALREKRLSADLDAYKRMRRQGMQPGYLTGAAVIEREARNQIEVEHPRLMGMPDEARGHLEEATQVAREIPGLLSAHKEAS